jgi:hypothetical protein
LQRRQGFLLRDLLLPHPRFCELKLISAAASQPASQPAKTAPQHTAADTNHRRQLAFSSVAVGREQCRASDARASQNHEAAAARNTHVISLSAPPMLIIIADSTPATAPSIITTTKKLSTPKIRSASVVPFCKKTHHLLLSDAFPMSASSLSW